MWVKARMKQVVVFNIWRKTTTFLLSLLCVDLVSILLFLLVRGLIVFMFNLSWHRYGLTLISLDDPLCIK
jgi:hypothetical protein